MGWEWAGDCLVPSVAVLDQIAHSNAAQRNDVLPADVEQWVKAFKIGFEDGYKIGNAKAFQVKAGKP